jgi:hypothetical protein
MEKEKELFWDIYIVHQSKVNQSASSVEIAKKN